MEPLELLRLQLSEPIVSESVMNHDEYSKPYGRGGVDSVGYMI